MNFSERVDFAKKWIREIGDYIKENYIDKKDLIINFKAETDIVTEADIKTENLIFDKIKENFIEDKIISEETGENKIGNGFTWVIDPIDGTNNFAQGLDYWAISIGILKDMKPFAGITYMPMLNKLFIAEIGKGAYCNNEKIFVGSKNILKNSISIVDSGMKGEGELEKYLYVCKRMCENVRNVIKYGSAVVESCYVANGKIDITLLRTAYIWDVAAITTIVLEAGGVVKQLNGEDICFDRISDYYLVVSNKELCDKIFEFNDVEKIF